MLAVFFYVFLYFALMFGTCNIIEHMFETLLLLLLADCFPHE